MELIRLQGIAANPDLVACQQVGDVVGIHYPGESEVALFIPDSGDVLLSRADQWFRLVELPAHSRDMALQCAGLPDSNGNCSVEVELATMLRTLGASLA